jgi:hemolysin activation/secretion protein
VPLLAMLMTATGKAEPGPESDLRRTAYEVRQYQIIGSRALEEEVARNVFAEATGSRITLSQICRALARLRVAYCEKGYPAVAVSLPQQVITNGTVWVKVVERARTLPAPDRPKALAFEVRRYEVVGNTLLKPETIDRVFGAAIGPAVTLEEIKKAAGELQLAYRERGYATVAVALPAQRITNATVQVRVTEGTLANVRVTGNRYFSSNNVMRALPSLQTHGVLNGQVFQRELDLANANRDRQIFPTLGPGPDPGTSTLNLRVVDRLPLHGRLDVDNYSTPGTPDWRINSALNYNNLWQHEHQAGLSYGFTPEAFKAGGNGADNFLSLPLVANGGAYYRLPLGTPEPVQEALKGSTRFGYNEATHQFLLPPPGARPDLTFFASASSSDTGVQFGPPQVVSRTPLLTILSQDSGENRSDTESAGARFNLPVAASDTRRLSLFGGPDLKRYFLATFNSNNFTITTVITNTSGSQTIESRVASPQPARQYETVYLPVSTGADYSQRDAGGTLVANLALSWNFLGNSQDFSALAYSRQARAGFGKALLALTRDQNILGRWSLLLRASGQAATGPLISAEQFALGGHDSVRGYYEGDEYGDLGWFGSGELRTPFLATTVPYWSGSTPVWLRALVFVDGGQRFLLGTSALGNPFPSLLGTGFGVSANLNNHFDMRIAVGWPLLDSANTRAGEPRAHFAIGGQF